MYLFRILERKLRISCKSENRIFPLGLLTFSLINFAQNPIPPSVVNFTADQEHTLIIQNFAYVTCIDTEINVPLWVSHAISKEIIEKGEIVLSSNKETS